jgi:hypothetical protein
MMVGMATEIESKRICISFVLAIVAVCAIVWLVNYGNRASLEPLIAMWCIAWTATCTAACVPSKRGLVGIYLGMGLAILSFPVYLFAGVFYFIATNGIG